MTRIEHERLIERYLAGEMAPAEEQEFFIQVAANDSLRQTLKAYRVVENALRKHRDHVPPLHADSRTRLMAMLNVPAAAQPQGSPAAHTLAAGGAAGRFFGALGWLLTAKGISLIVGTTLLGITTFLLTSSTGDVPHIAAPTTPAVTAPIPTDRPAGQPTENTVIDRTAPSLSPQPHESLDQQSAAQENPRSVVTGEPRRTATRSTETRTSTTNALRPIQSTPAPSEAPALQQPSEPKAAATTHSATTQTKPKDQSTTLKGKFQINSLRKMPDDSTHK